MQSTAFSGGKSRLNRIDDYTVPLALHARTNTPTRPSANFKLLKNPEHSVLSERRSHMYLHTAYLPSCFGSPFIGRLRQFPEAPLHFNPFRVWHVDVMLTTGFFTLMTRDDRQWRIA